MSRGKDSNLQPLLYKSIAQPLSYPGIRGLYQIDLIFDIDSKSAAIYHRSIMLDNRIVSRLYNKIGLSANEIAHKYNISVWRVISFMRRNKILRRKPYETQKLQFERKELSFHKKEHLQKNDQKLLLSGLCLYWAEGSKANKAAVDFANCNERMLLIFLKMLREIYVVDESRLRVYIYCFANQNSEELIKYWSLQLKIPPTQFSKPYIRKDFKIEKIGKMPLGLIHIRYYDQKLLRQIISDIDIIATSLLNRSWDGGVVNRI